MTGSNRGRRALFGIAAVSLIALSGAACTAAMSPSPEASAPSAIATAAASPSGSAETFTPSPAIDTPAPTDTGARETPLSPTPFPPASATPPLPTGPLPSVGPIDAGLWTGIKWIAVPGGHSPAVPPVNPVEYWPGPVHGNSVLQGWSGGYVEFVWNPHTRTLNPWASADGLEWKSSSNLVNTSQWKAFFKRYDDDNAAAGLGPAYHDACAFRVDNFQEGPATLLMAGYVDCTGPGICLRAFDSWTRGDTAWTSQDGLTWTQETLSHGIDGGLISGGSSGFVARGSEGLKATIWTSQDGRNWLQGALPAAAYAAGSSVRDPISFGGGFVLPGEVMVKKGTVEDGCPGSNSNQYQGGLWWSQDGKTWTRDSLTGVNSTSYYDAMMSVVRIDDHTVVAKQYGSTSEWASSDGKTWALLKGRPVVFPGYGSGPNIVVGHDRGLVFDGGPCAFDDSLTLVPLKQTGDLPWSGSQYGLGPTGLLASYEGARFWIGVPAAG